MTQFVALISGLVGAAAVVVGLGYGLQAQSMRAARNSLALFCGGIGMAFLAALAWLAVPA